MDPLRVIVFIIPRIYAAFSVYNIHSTINHEYKIGLKVHLKITIILYDLFQDNQ